jgi:hypothetical protein
MDNLTDLQKLCFTVADIVSTILKVYWYIATKLIDKCGPDARPWVMLLAACILFLLIRAFWCWFWKTTHITERLGFVEEQLGKIHKLQREAFDRHTKDRNETFLKFSDLLHSMDAHLKNLDTAGRTAAAGGNGQLRPLSYVVQPGNGEQPQ